MKIEYLTQAEYVEKYMSFFDNHDETRVKVRWENGVHSLYFDDGAIMEEVDKTYEIVLKSTDWDTVYVLITENKGE